MTLQEHFVDEMRAYRQDPSKGRDVSSPAGSSTDRHARSTPSTPSEIESRVEVKSYYNCPHGISRKNGALLKDFISHAFNVG